MSLAKGNLGVSRLAVALSRLHSSAPKKLSVLTLLEAFVSSGLSLRVTNIRACQINAILERSPLKAPVVVERPSLLSRYRTLVQQGLVTNRAVSLEPLQATIHERNKTFGLVLIDVDLAKGHTGNLSIQKICMLYDWRYT